MEGARDNDWDAQAENATGEDGEKEMGFISASAMDPAKFDRMDQEVCHSRSPRRSCQCSIDMQYLKQKKAQLAALGQWKHIHCLRRRAREQIGDEILKSLVYVPPDEEESDDDEDDFQDGNRNGKASASSLLDVLDLKKVLKETRPALAIDRVPGGSVSFLFERTSEKQVESEAVDEEP